ncbi:hypothetical protein [Listeria cornellensis]|uniref:Uncharacterized protein n=1 Tax=Listeria cornellensis FSL F6-0969 TaxID=1265820 RepID=W7BEK1_9LIST|nr:hypothetical protein [Listeria cornellensis]EUJ24347.1 hypothetical protein PCORN_18696 [Listeria cornellensis FSL F6-0969]
MQQKKKKLQISLDKAIAQLAKALLAEASAEASVKDLFDNNDVKGLIKEITNQVSIDSAQILVNAVTDTARKSALQLQLDEAKKTICRAYRLNDFIRCYATRNGTRQWNISFTNLDI